MHQSSVVGVGCTMSLPLGHFPFAQFQAGLHDELTPWHATLCEFIEGGLCFAALPQQLRKQHSIFDSHRGPLRQMRSAGMRGVADENDTASMPWSRHQNGLHWPINHRLWIRNLIA